MMNNQSAIDKFINLAERLSKPKVSSQLEYWQGQATLLADKCKKTMVVTNDGGNFQVWHKNIADRCGAEYGFIAEYVGGNQNA
jgi:hypothetical protein